MSPGKRQAAVDSSFSLTNWLTVYGSVFWNDAIRRTAYNPGIYFPRIPRLPKLDLRAEYVSTEVPPDPGEASQGELVYWDVKYHDEYMNKGDLLGSWVGRQGRGTQLWSTYWLSPRSTVQLSYRHGSISPQFIPQGGTLADVGVQADFCVRAGMSVRASVQYERWNIPLLASHTADGCGDIARADLPAPMVEGMIASMPAKAQPEIGPRTAGCAAAGNRCAGCFGARMVPQAAAPAVGGTAVALPRGFAGNASGRFLGVCFAQALRGLDAVDASRQSVDFRDGPVGRAVWRRGQRAGKRGRRPAGAEELRGPVHRDSAQPDRGTEPGRALPIDQSLRSALGRGRPGGVARQYGDLGGSQKRHHHDRGDRQESTTGGGHGREYVEELNRVVTELNTSSAHRERVFLEGRLAEVQQDLESAEKGFSEFASKNTAIDIQAQGKAMIESAATLEGQMVAAQTELEGLKQIYAGDNVRVRTIQARVDELERQLQKLGGKSVTASASDGLHAPSPNDPSMYPSIRELPLLGVSYADLFVNPQPTPQELREFYARYDDGEQWRSREEHFNRGVRRAILRRKRPGTVLDIGCGSGNFLRCMKQAGFSAFGIEPSESGSDFARAEHGIEIYRGMIEEYFASPGKRQFDVVTLLNVLEHLSDPSRTLAQVRQILAPGGLLAIVVPDARFHDLLGRLRRALGLKNPYWLEQSGSVLAGFKLPDHLCSFQPRTIAALLEHCGFRLVALQNAPLIFNAGLQRNLGKMLVRWTSQALHECTFGRVLVGYSTLALARKE